MINGIHMLVCNRHGGNQVTDSQGQVGAEAFQLPLSRQTAEWAPFNARSEKQEYSTSTPLVVFAKEAVPSTGKGG